MTRRDRRESRRGRQCRGALVHGFRGWKCRICASPADLDSFELRRCTRATDVRISEHAVLRALERLDTVMRVYQGPDETVEEFLRRMFIVAKRRKFDLWDGTGQLEYSGIHFRFVEIDGLFVVVTVMSTAQRFHAARRWWHRAKRALREKVRGG